MSDLKEAESEVILVSSFDLDPETRYEAIWESFQRHDANVKQEGAHDPEVWKEIQNPDPENPAKVFFLETATGRAHVVPHLGVIALAS